MTYAGGKAHLVQDIAKDPVLVFQTGSVISDSGACFSYYASGWREFSQGMQLLAGEYSFRYNRAAPAVEKFGVKAGVENHIR